MVILNLICTASLLTLGLHVVQGRNPVYAVMCLVLLFANASALLIIEELEFFALLNIIIYIGALSVMFLFVVMLLNITLTEIVAHQRATYFTTAQSVMIWAISLLSLLDVMPASLKSGGTNSSANQSPLSFNETWTEHSLFESLISQLGYKLYLEQADLLIMASLLLLVAMIGAVVLTRLPTVATGGVRK